MAIEIVPTSFAQAEKTATAAGVVLPLEQTETWARYQSTVTDRTPWRPLGEGKDFFLLRRDGKDLAVVTFIDLLTHGYRFLRATHGPVWFAAPSEADEAEAAQALVAFVHKTDPKVAFLRYAIKNEIPASRPVLSTRPYDQTVIVDVTGGDEAILKRMKSRGRRDVRKSLRENHGTVADETDKALKSFKEYYAIMEDTGKRDGFVPAPISNYENMIRSLGAEHCRVYAIRNEKGVVEAWSLVTINGTLAVRFYAAMRSGAMRLHATDKLLYSECCLLGQRGITRYDLMGIGDDFAPTLKGLNEFKTKFAKDGERPVAPDRDLPLRPRFYGALVAAKKLRAKARSHASGEKDA